MLAAVCLLALGVTDLFPFFLLGGRCTSDSSPPPAASLFGLWLSVQRHSGNAVLSHRFRLPRRRSDDTQVAGIDDYFAKVQHCGFGISLRSVALACSGLVAPHSSVHIYSLRNEPRRRIDTRLLFGTLLKAAVLIHFQMAWRDLSVHKTVRVFLLGTVQLLTILVDVFEHSAAVGRRQLEPHLPWVGAFIALVELLLELLHGVQRRNKTKESVSVHPATPQLDTVVHVSCTAL